jgi:hypothetical protein
MKAKIWVLCTVLADENAPAMPAVFADEAEAWAKYDEMIRAEWENLMDADDGPYPGDPDEAQDRIRQAHGRRMEPLGADMPRDRNSGSEIATGAR